jgi:ribosome-associated translation inhibitor RaiA
MELPLQICFRYVDYRAAGATQIRERAAQLRRYDGTILNCHVVVEQALYGDEPGRYHVRIEMSVPGEALVIEHEPRLTPEDLSHTVHEAFDKAQRRLQGYARRRRGLVLIKGIETAVSTWLF